MYIGRFWRVFSVSILILTQNLSIDKEGNGKGENLHVRNTHLGSYGLNWDNTRGLTLVKLYRLYFREKEK